MFALAMAAMLTACSVAPVLTNDDNPEETGMKSISFEMSPQAVLEQVKSQDTIIESTVDRIVSEGPWEVDASIRRKTFSFHENKLQCIRYEYLRGNNALSSITFTFCK